MYFLSGLDTPELLREQINSMMTFANEAQTSGAKK
jgi:hypothetical protein